MHQGPEKWRGGGGGGPEIGVCDRGLFCAVTERRLSRRPAEECRCPD